MLKAPSNHQANTVSNILVPVDFSQASKTAMQLAFDWSRLLKCHITLFHSYRLIANESLIDIDPKMVREQIVLEKKKAFEKLKQEIDFSKAHSYSYLIELGFAHELVTRFAKDNDIDLVIMGLKSSGSEEVLRGFKSMVKKTSVPIVVIDKDYPFLTNKEIKKLDILSMENSIFVNNFDKKLEELKINPGQLKLIYPSPDHEKQFTGKLPGIADRIINFKKSTQ